MKEARTDDDATEGEESVMHVGAALVTNPQPAEGVQPGEGAFHHPAVTAQALAGLDAAAGDARTDAPVAQRSAASRIVVAFVHVRLGGPPPGSAAPAPHGGDGVQRRLHHLGIMRVRRRERCCERYALLIDHEVVFGPDFPSVGGIATGLGPPFGAGMADPSSATRSHCRRSSRWSASSRARHARAHTPAACQATNRRQQLTPEPQPSSFGSAPHGRPWRNTKRMPVRACRSGIGGRPPRHLARRLRFGRCGSITPHSSSDKSSAMPACAHLPLACPGQVLK